MLITAEEARLQIPGLTGTGEDSKLETLITALGRAFARHCGYPGTNPSMESTSYTRFLDGPGGRDLVLDVWPVVSVTSLYDDPTLDFTDSQYLVSSGDYAVIDANQGLVRLKSTATHGAWNTAKGCIKATYTAGYATVPDDLKHAARLAVRAWWDLLASQGKKSVSQNGNSTQFEDAAFLTIPVKQALSQFLLPRVFL